MPRVQRTDVTRIDGAKRTREGYIDTHGSLTRTGVFEYMREDGTVQRELRLPEHIFDAASIASVHGQPLTLQHPSRILDSRTFKAHAVGFVFDPYRADDGTHLRARIRVMDAGAVEAVERGLKELSNGYEATLVPVEGGKFRRDDFNGGVEVSADFLQTEILINHTALVDRGRAGPSARLDSAGNQDQGDPTTMMTPEEKQALEDAKNAAEKAKQEAAAEKSRADSLAGKVASYEAAKVKEAEDAAAKAKSGLAAQVALILKKDALELVKLDESAIMCEALAKLQPSLKVDGWSVEMLRGAFNVVAVASEASRTDTVGEMARFAGAARAVTADAEEDDENASQKAFENSRREAASAWQKSAK